MHQPHVIFIVTVRVLNRRGLTCNYRFGDSSVPSLKLHQRRYTERRVFSIYRGRYNALRDFRQAFREPRLTEG